ncbi:hypothetical protein, partial [Actinocorallia lasiicapitis]
PGRAGLGGALQRKLRDRRVVKGLAALTVGVLGGVLVITLLRGLGGDEEKAAPQSAKSEQPGAAFTGAWKGTVTNQNGVKFTVELAFQDGDRAKATISTGPCSAELARTGGEGGTRQMSLTVKTGPCTSGVVTLTDKDGALDWAWAKGDRHYEGRLTRQ